MLKFQPPSAQGPPAISHRYVYVPSAASPEYKNVQRAGYYLFPICDPYILQTQMNSKPDMHLTVTMTRVLSQLRQVSVLKLFLQQTQHLQLSTV